MMAYVHVFTGFEDSTELMLWCPICKCETMHKVGYLGRWCGSCDLMLEDFANPIITHYKRIHGLSWRSFGALFGWTASTMTTYYWKDPKRILDRMVRQGLISYEDGVVDRKW